MKLAALVLLFAGCASEPSEIGPTNGGGTTANPAVPDVRCAGAPQVTVPDDGFRHASSSIAAALGDPRHRGIDLIASASSDPQQIEGWMAYTAADKALEDEDVDVYACMDQQWQKLGRVRTGDEGKFTMTLSEGERLPAGIRDLYASVVGDGSGVHFIGYVAPDGSPVIVSDVDGTLTDSENAFIETLAGGEQPSQQTGASTAYSAAAARGFQLIYVTSRGNQYTEDTRHWLADQGFPRGPLRLAPTFVTLPGSDTVDYKAGAIGQFSDSLDVIAGVGNRDSDISAYTKVGVPADRIFIKLPEYQSEVATDLAAGKAIGFAAYSDLQELVPSW